MAQEKGFINEDLEAILSVQLINGSDVECIIDTGFNGSLLLPRKFVEDNSLALVGREPVTMVEQNIIEVDVVSGEINWLGGKSLVRVLVSETNEALIGTQMLAASVMEIDYKNKTVKITK
ncbi:MAG TPA: hypothetical protein VK400_10615 [Pyrinomonadaceae bacterium]|nr:hypothetical protein [Pyrinomonadaceae bacterium]